MHTNRTGIFLLELVKQAKKDQSKEMFSYLSGYLCHYALDKNTHPLINQLAGKENNKHEAIERRLDRIMLEKQGMTLKNRPITKKYFPAFLPEEMKPALNSAFENVYGWHESWHLLKTSFIHMKWYHYITEDPTKLFDKTIGRMIPKAKGLSFQTNCFELESYDWFWPVFETSINEAINFISKSYEYFSGKISEKELSECIGNRSYSTGETLNDY